MSKQKATPLPAHQSPQNCLPPCLMILADMLFLSRSFYPLSSPHKIDTLYLCQSQWPLWKLEQRPRCCTLQIIISVSSIYEVLCNFFQSTFPSFLIFNPQNILVWFILKHPMMFFSGLHAVIKKGICYLFTNKEEVRKDKNLLKNHKKYYNITLIYPPLTTHLYC